MTLEPKEEFIAQCMAGTQKTREECEAEWTAAQTSTDQQTKEEYVAECVAGGERTAEECAAAWEESHAPATDYKTLQRTVKMLRTKLDRSNRLLKEATQIIKAVNIEKDAVEEAKKFELALEIEKDTDGKESRKDLMQEDLKTLVIMKTAIDKAKPKGFVSVAALDANRKAATDRGLSVGEYDPIAKKWVN